MRKSCRRTVRPKVPSMLVTSLVQPDVIMAEYLTVEAFRGGYATTSHWNTLNSCRDMLIAAAHEKGDQDVLAVTHVAGIALDNIKIRYHSTERMGVTGEELKAISLLVETSDDFWKRQSGQLYRQAVATVDRAQQLFKEKVNAS